MAQENSPAIRQRAQLERKLNKRPSYDRILIVCEGSKTEPLYFSEIRQTYRLHTANVEVRPCQLGTAPIQVVQYAKELFEQGDRHKRIQPRAFEQVYAVFDRDDHDSYFNALQFANSLKGKLKNDNKEPIIFRAIASIPNFELWLLLHFEDIQHFLPRTEVLRRLKSHIPNYDKGLRGCFSLTRDKLEFAFKRAKLLSTQYTAFDDENAYTDMWELVTVLTKLGS